MNLLKILAMIGLATAMHSAPAGENRTGTLNVTVVDGMEEFPTRNASVLIRRHFGDGQIVKLQEQKRGSFEIQIAPGFYDVYIGASGFVPKCAVIEIIAGKNTSFKAHLDPDEHQLQQSAHQEVSLADRAKRLFGTALTRRTL